jgi:hypothetical protein
MGNEDNKSIEEYILDGWSFRIKKGKNYFYITRRKGQLERSLGRYSEELVDRINSIYGKLKINKRLKKKKLKMDEKKHDLERCYRFFDAMMFGLKSTDCVHIDSDGFCMFWNWDEKPYHFIFVDQVYGENQDLYALKKIQLDGETKERWLFKATRRYCRYCPSYIRKESNY